MAVNPCFNGWLGNFAKMLVALALMCAGAGRLEAAAPANDNFANATALVNLLNNTGTITGSNVGATKEAGEPVVAGVGGGKTIWYVWTAPFTGTIEFNTEGSSFDTVLGAYTGTNVAGLTLVAENDDVAFPSDLTSRIQFAVTQGTNYYIAVDGNEGDSGSVILNWTPTGTYSAGDFTIAIAPTTVTGIINNGQAGTPVIAYSQFDEFYYGAFTANMVFEGPKARLIRTNGTAGNVVVNYVVTNTYYTDIFFTNFSGTNIYLISGNTNYITTNFTTTNQYVVTNGNIAVTNFVYTTNIINGTNYDSATNYNVTNITFDNQYQDYTVAKGFFYCPVIGSYTIQSTNIGSITFYATNFTVVSNGGTIATGTNTAVVVAGPQLPPVTNATVYTNKFVPPNPCQNFFLTSSPTNTNGLAFTNIFCVTTTPTNVIVPSASNQVDYIAISNSISLIDYQLAADLPLQLNSGNALLTTNVDPTFVRNHLLQVNITGVALDPNESSNIAPPVISSSNFYVLLLNDYVQSDSCVYSNQLPVVQFANSIYYTRETLGGGLGSTVKATIWLRRFGSLANGCSVQVAADDTGPPDHPGRLNTFALQPGSDYATPPNSVPGSREAPHYAFSNPTVSWGVNDAALKEVDVTINYDPTVQFNEDLQLELYNASSCVIGQQGTCTVTILSQDQPAGAVDRSHNPDHYYATVPPFNSSPGAGDQYNTVLGAVIQPDNKTVFVGDFPTYNTHPRSGVARMNFDGSIDTNFMASPNNGANYAVNCVALQSDGGILIGGSFTSFNGTNRFHIARLNTDGSLDLSYNTGLGANTNVNAIAIQSDGNAIIAGSFTQINGTNRNYIARLNTSGGLDPTFNAGTELNGPVNTIAIQGDGKIVVGGDFTQVNGQNQGYIARLNTDGTVDTNFNVGTGADHPVYALAFQTDGRIVVGGAFNFINLFSRNSIARLNSDGSLDPSFDPGSGADDTIYTVALQQDGGILLGGLFQSFNGTRRIGIARLYTDGTVDTTFMDTSYNQFAGLINTFHNTAYQPKNFLKTMAVQPDGNIIIGGRFSLLGGDPSPSGMTHTNIYDYSYSIYARDNIAVRENIARLIGGSTTNTAPGNIGLFYDSYSADKTTGSYYVTMQRINGALGPASVTFSPTPLHAGGGSAVPGADYLQTTQNPAWTTTWSGDTWMYSDDLEGMNNESSNVLNQSPFVIGTPFFTVLNNTNSTGNLDLNFQLSQPVGSLSLGGEPIPTGVALARSTAPMTLVDDTVPAGSLQFTTNNLFVNENAGNAYITVQRVGGSAGQVSVRYQTIPGTAQPGATNDYGAVSGTLTFQNGQISQTFSVPIVNNFVVAPDKHLTLQLSNPFGGAQLGSNSTAQLTIINDNYLPGHVSFTYSNYVVHNSTGYVTVGVNRLGGLQGTISVNYSTSDGAAVNGTDYTATNGTLIWASGDTSVKTFTVPILNTQQVNTNNIAFNLNLSNPTNNGVAAPYVLTGLFTNATVTIINDNSYGIPTLSALQYYVNENAGTAIVTVNRIGGSSQTLTVNYATADGTAINGTDYNYTSGTLTFAPGQTSQSFPVQIIDTLPPVPGGQQTNDGTYFNVSLSSPTPVSGPGGAAQLGTPSNAVVTIQAETVENQPPGNPDTSYDIGAGFNGTVSALALQSNGSLLVGGNFTQAGNVVRNYIGRLNPDGTLDNKFSSQSEGANAPVRAITIQSDGQILVGGLFTTMNGVNQHYISRLNYSGTSDSSFNVGSGADNPVYAIAESLTGPTNLQTRTIIIGGSFASVQGVPYRGVARLSELGAIDTTFAASGVNGTVYALAVYPSTDLVNGGKILVGGDFTTVNNSPVAYIARLNPDGTLDTTFNNPIVTSGPNGAVRSLVLQLDGNIVIGGVFNAVNGTPANSIARLQPDGELDSTFNPGPGMDGPVTALALQQDLKIVAGGSFTHAGGVTRNRITRLNSDGSTDAGINFGQGANDFVDAIVVQPDTKIVIGGNFTTYDGVPEAYLARIYGGTETGDGMIEFNSANYQINQGVTNIVIGVIRVGGTGYNPLGSPDTVTLVASTSDGTAISGVDYTGVTNTLVFPPGEVYQSIVVPILSDPTNFSQLYANLNLTDIYGNPWVGNQSSALLTLVGSSSTVSYSSPAYSVAKNVSGGLASITVNRNGSTLETSSVDCYTTTNGTATPGVDYTPVTNTIVFPPGASSETFGIPIIPNGLPEGNLTVGLAMTNPTNTVIDQALPNTATLTIVDNVSAPGNFTFASNSFSIADGNTNAIITVIRTNGSVGQVSVNYAANGGTATLADYVPTNGSLTFLDGQTSKTFSVPIVKDTNLTGSVTVNLTLSIPSANSGTGIVGVNPATLIINDNNLNVSFAQAGYSVDEKNGVVIVGVNRFGNTNGTIQVNYSTSDGTAFNGVNYTTTTNTLTFLPGQTFQSFQIPISYDPQITGNLVFYVTLYPQAGSGVQAITPSTATVTVLDDDVGLALATSTASIVKANTNAVISVLRTGSEAGTVSVNYTANTGSAAPNVEYVPVTGVLTFLSGQASNSFVVPIINDNQIDGDQTVNISLSNPTNGAILLTPALEVLTIVDNQTAFAFSNPTYTVNENGVSALITVLRTGFLNSTASVNYSTSDGTAKSGLQYNGVSGTLNFTNGQSTATFTVPIIDNNVTGGSEAFNLLLTSPSANASLISPVAASVTILNNDGSLIVPDGAVVQLPANGVLTPGSSATVLLSLLNTAGSTATNVIATIQSTNGITATGTTSQNYGNLTVSGPSAFRQFTFTVNNTNLSGTSVNAVLQLQFQNNLGTRTSTVSYTFAVGSTTNAQSNTNAIIISDLSAATPYPSVINISGLSGNISKVTATVSNLSHTFVSDVAMLLVGPAGQKVLLMETNGANFSVNNVTLTFDATSANVIGANAPVTGTYRPAPILTNLAFPVATNGNVAPSQPYANSLNDFVGTSPNGTWQLYVCDQKFLDSGAISKGWSLNITTLSTIAPNNDLIIGTTVSPQTVVVGSNLVYTVSVTNAGPSPATGVTVTSVLPPGFTNFSVSGAAGNSYSTNGGTGAVTVSSTIGGLATNGTATFTISGAAPLVSGPITNTVSVAGNEFEDNPLNNTNVVASTVANPSADLGISVGNSPNPVLVGNLLTFTVTVTNLGPATATGVLVSNTLPAGVTYVSSTAASVVTNAPVYSFNIGSLGSGGSTTFNVVVMPTLPQLLFETFGVGSSLYDPLKGNNVNTLKVIVQALPLSFQTAPGGLTISWPSGSGLTYHVQSSTSLVTPNWSTNGIPAPVLNGANYTVTVPISSSGSKYFRLVSP